MSNEVLANGVVLAVNYIPDSVEPNIVKFWAQATEALAQKGFLLIVATTAPLSQSGINSIEVPFTLPEFLQRYPDVAGCDGAPLEASLVAMVQSWYRCDEALARQSLRVAERFYADLFEALQPCAVLTWQSTHPKSAVLQRLARSEGIPIWNAERGWLRDTVMIDLAENTYFNERQTSFALSRCLELLSLDAAYYESLKDQALGGVLAGRYKSNPVIEKEALCARYGLPADARLFAFFMHGEPFLLRNANPLPAQFHALSLSGLQAQLSDLAEYCAANDLYLLIQDHPFNDTVGVKIKLPASKRVVPVKENIHSVLQAADRAFFTTSTIQYDAIFYGKPFGVLCRTSADVAEGAYSVLEHASSHAFFEAVDKAVDWDNRHLALKKLICFLGKAVLFDITEEGRAASAERFASHLSRFVRPVDTALNARIDTFLSTWRC